MGAGGDLEKDGSQHKQNEGAGHCVHERVSSPKQRACIFAYPADASCAMLRRTMTPTEVDDPPRPGSEPPGEVVNERRSPPPQVYRSKVYRSKEANGWIVEPPRDMASTVGKMVFTGTQAQHLALTYAYETFGNARFFPYSGEASD